MDKVNILGVNIDNLDMEEAKLKVVSFLNSEKINMIFTPNSEIVMEAKKNEKFRKVLNTADLTTADGIGLVYASKIKNKPLSERVTGFDLSMEILKIAAENGKKVYLLGGAEGIAKKAKEKIEEKYDNIKIVGTHNGYFEGYHRGIKNSPEEEKIIQEINDSGAEILFVGLGAPAQEMWINHNKDKFKNLKIVIGNGGTMDVIAEKVKRAPEFYQKMGLEWFYRLIKEPKRIKRQIQIPIFLFTIITNKDSVK